jgi:hypothetical protein
LKAGLRVSIPDLRKEGPFRGRDREAGGDAVVARQVEIDHAPFAHAAAIGSPRRMGLEQSRGQVARLRQEEEADLSDVGAGGDVDEIILGLGIERIGAGEIEQLPVHLLEIPRVGEVEQVRPHLRLRRDSGDVGGDVARQPLVEAAVDQLEAIDPQILVHAQADARPPLVPARWAHLACVECGADEAKDDGGSHLYIMR